VWYIELYREMKNRKMVESRHETAFLKKCVNCGKRTPIASEECQYCGTKQP
jgi:ribosomal protein L40E